MGGNEEKRNRYVVAPCHNAADTHVHIFAAKGEADNLLHALTTLNGDVTGDRLLPYFSPPLHLASADGHAACVRLLLERGAAPVRDLPERGGRTPLHVAAIGGHAAACEALLDAGCNINATDSAGGTTPLHAACFRGHDDVVALLLDRGASTKIRAKHSNELPLHAACRGRALKVVEMLATRETQGKEVLELPGVVELLRAPVEAGAIYTRPAQHAYYHGGFACAAPIDGVLSDCATRIVPPDPDGKEPGGAWQAAIASRAPGTATRPPPAKIEPPPVVDLRPDGPPRPPVAVTIAKGGFGGDCCRLCRSDAKDALGFKASYSHATDQHWAWLDVSGVSRRRRNAEKRQDVANGRLAPGEVPWRSW